MDYRYARSGRPFRRTRLEVESLESRDCPAAPSISLNTQQLSDGRVRVWGTVSDERPDNITVNLGGVVNANTYTLIGGIFLWEGNATDLGTVTADCHDDENLPAAQATATLTNNAPSITLNISYGDGREVTLSGIVSDETAGGQTVVLCGVVGGTVVTNADGTYSWTGEAFALGTITADVSDVWAAAASTASVAAVSDAPVISNFMAFEEEGPNNTWIFEGQVTDESFFGLEVRFSGLPSLQGKTTTVASNGLFTLMVYLQDGEDGTVWCQTTDWWGLDSNVASASVYQTPPPEPGIGDPPPPPPPPPPG